MHDDLLHEQLNYYRARAAEYDESLQSVGDPGAAESAEAREWQQAVRALRGLGPQGRVLELAGGTGIWTQELARIAGELTVLDGAPEMLARNRAKLGDARITYQTANLFAWEPTERYDLVFFAFWLSRVPPERLDAFLDNVERAVAPGGRVFVVDEPAGGSEVSGPNAAGMYQQRTLRDGRAFSIVKVYYDPTEIGRQLEQRGFAPSAIGGGAHFFHLSSQRR